MNNNQSEHTDEISLKELILKVKEYIGAIWNSWLLIGIMSLFTTAFFLYQHYTFVPKYKAELRFVVEGQSGVSGGLGSLLGSFGIKKGGKVNPYKILEVGKSQRLLKTVLSANADDEETIGNKLLKAYDLVEIWKEQDPQFEGFHFDSNSFSDEASILDRTAMKKIGIMFWGTEDNRKDAAVRFELDEDTGIYAISAVFENERLSQRVSEEFYSGIKEFFEDQIFLNQKQSADILAAKADSLKVERDQKLYEIAQFEETNRSLISKTAMVRRNVLSQEVTALNLAYAEVLKTYQLTDVNLKDIQPLFMTIDTPTLPLMITRSSLLMSLLKGLTLGGFLGVLFVILRKIYADALTS